MRLLGTEKPLLVGLLCVLLFACSSESSQPFSPVREISLEITGRQFVWEVKHPGPDERLGTADDRLLENQIVLPVGTRAHLKIKSADVVHGFWVPGKNIKLTLLPGKTYERHLDLDKIGKFRLACSELCGAGHGNMIGWVVVLSEEKYQEWLREPTH